MRGDESMGAKMATEKKTYLPAVRQVLGTPVTLEAAAEELAREKGQDPDLVKVTAGEDELRRVARRLALKAFEREKGRLEDFFSRVETAPDNKIVYNVVRPAPADLRDLGYRKAGGEVDLSDSLIPFFGTVPKGGLGEEAYDVNGRLFFSYPADSLYGHAASVIEVRLVTDEGQALLNEYAAQGAGHEGPDADWDALLNYVFSTPSLSEAPNYASDVLGQPRLEYVYEGPATLNRVCVRELGADDPAYMRGKTWEARLLVDGQPSPVGRACGDLEEAKGWCRDYLGEVGSPADPSLEPAEDVPELVGGLDTGAASERDEPEPEER